MKYYLIFLIFLLMRPLDALTQPLAVHRWEDRLILIFSTDLQAAAMQEQMTLFSEEKTALEDRDLLIYRISPTEVVAPKGYERLSSDRLFEYYRVDKKDQLTVILVGKDGGEKLRSPGVTAAREIFALIDTMPMRRAEMKRKGKGG